MAFAEWRPMATTNSVPPCDFLQFLAQERSMTVPAAAELVGQCLLDYEPGEQARSMGMRPRNRASRPRVCRAA